MMIYSIILSCIYKYLFIYVTPFWPLINLVYSIHSNPSIVAYVTTRLCRCIFDFQVVFYLKAMFINKCDFKCIIILTKCETCAEYCCHFTNTCICLLCEKYIDLVLPMPRLLVYVYLVQYWGKVLLTSPLSQFLSLIHKNFTF